MLLSSIYWSFTGEGSVSVPCPFVSRLPGKIQRAQRSKSLESTKPSRCQSIYRLMTRSDSNHFKSLSGDAPGFPGLSTSPFCSMVVPLGQRATPHRLPGVVSLLMTCRGKGKLGSVFCALAKNLLLCHVAQPGTQFDLIDDSLCRLDYQVPRFFMFVDQYYIVQ